MTAFPPTQVTFDVASWKSRWRSNARDGFCNAMAEGSWSSKVADLCEERSSVLRAELQAALAVASPVERAELEAADSWSRTREAIGLAR